MSARSTEGICTRTVASGKRVYREVEAWESVKAFG